MFVQRCGIDRGRGSRKELPLPGLERAALEKGHALIEQAELSRDFEIVCDDEGQPDPVIGYAGS